MLYVLGVMDGTGVWWRGITSLIPPSPPNNKTPTQAQVEQRAMKLDASLQEQIQEAMAARRALEAAQQACAEKEAAVRAYKCASVNDARFNTGCVVCYAPHAHRHRIVIPMEPTHNPQPTQVATLRGQLASAEAELAGLSSLPAALEQASGALAQARAECEAKERTVRSQAHAGVGRDASYVRTPPTTRPHKTPHRWRR